MTTYAKARGIRQPDVQPVAPSTCHGRIAMKDFIDSVAWGTKEEIRDLRDACSILSSVYYVGTAGKVGLGILIYTLWTPLCIAEKDGLAMLQTTGIRNFVRKTLNTFSALRENYCRYRKSCRLLPKLKIGRVVVILGFHPHPHYHHHNLNHHQHHHNVGII